MFPCCISKSNLNAYVNKREKMQCDNLCECVKILLCSIKKEFDELTNRENEKNEQSPLVCFCLYYF